LKNDLVNFLPQKYFQKGWEIRCKNKIRV